MKPRLRVAVFCAIGFFAAALGFWLHSEQLNPRSPQLDALWSTPFKDLGGATVTLSALKGRPMVVNFWATWCPPCLEEMPDFQRASQTESGKKVQIVGIGIDYADKMRSFAVKNGITYLLLEAGAGGVDIVKSAGNTSGALPYTLLIDRNGAVVKSKLGKMDYAELMLAIDGLLSK